MVRVTPTAFRRFGHSRRTANHRTPTPGVTLVRRTNAQAAGHRNPATIAAAIRMSMLPSQIEYRTGGYPSSATTHHRPTKTSATKRQPTRSQ